MGKKLRGRQGFKATRGKGKGSLVHASKLARKRHNERQQANSKKRKLERVHLDAKKERRRKNAFVPYHVEDTILLIGEGNFSFARALVRRFEGVATRLIATSYDTKEQVITKYPEFPTVLEELETAGVSVVYGVDCTALESNTDLRVAIETMQQSCAKTSDAINTGLSVFDKIVFNFPHTACGIKDTLENNRVHQRFLTSFFHSATTMLRPTSTVQGQSTLTEKKDFGSTVITDSTTSSSSSSSSGGGGAIGTSETGVKSRKTQFGLSQIHVTLKTGEPYASWQIPRMAKLTGMLRLQTAIDFYPALYSGYEHRRTLGGFRGKAVAAAAAAATTTAAAAAAATTVDGVDAAAVAAGGYPGPDWSKGVQVAAKPKPNKTLEANNDVVGARTYLFIKGIKAMENEKIEMERRAEQEKYDQKEREGGEMSEEEEEVISEFSVKIGGQTMTMNVSVSDDE